MVHNILPRDAWAMITDKKDSYLLDIRTKIEWEAGYPDLSSAGKEVIRIEWRTLPGMGINPCFEQELIRYIDSKKSILMFICKSGARSYEAANFMKSLGYCNCYNVEHGFCGESPLSWRAIKLPCN